MSESIESDIDNNFSINDKLVSIKVNDIFDELSEQNQRLRKQLVLANKYNTILQKFKHYLDINSMKCQCFHTNRNQLDLIYSEYNEFCDNQKRVYFEHNFEENINLNISDICNKNNSNRSTLIVKPIVNKARKTLKSELSDNKSSITEWRRKRKPEVQKYKCVWSGCHFKTHRQKILNDHINIHNNVRPYVCDDISCGKTFFSDKCLRAHQKLHNEGKGYKTSTASEELVTFKSCYQITTPEPKAQKLLKQIEIKKEVEEGVEAMNDNVTEVQNDINLNNTNNDNESNKCDKNTTNDGIYSLKKYRYSCQWVGCNFKTQKNICLRDHMNIHKNIQPYVCPEVGCRKRFYSAKSLGAHRKRHLDSGEYKCSYADCGFNGRTLDIVMAHIKLVHSNDQPFYCSNCVMSFQTEYLFRRHLASHLDANYKCDYPECQFKCNQLSKYTIHLRKHTGEKPFKCDFPKCGKLFSGLNGLKDHKIRHSDLRPHHCLWPGCEAKFKRANDLKMHSNYHTNERLLKCDWPGCEFRTLTNKVLKEHEMKHNGESYECTWDKCDRKFKLKDDLETHLRLHENPLKCDWPGCEKTYTLKSSFKHHMHSHRKQILKSLAK